MRALWLAVAAFTLTLSASAWGSPPDRSKGISTHMLPKRVADLDGRQWGLVVSYAEYLKSENSQPVLQSPTDLLAFVWKQAESVQENGVWIVTTHPDAYSGPENKFLENIKALARSEKIPLFISRAAELPNGWKRYDAP